MATYVNSKILDRFVLDYEPPEEKFIADEILTTVPVKELSAKYAIFQRHPSKPSDDAIGHKSETQKMDTGRTKTESNYSTESRGLKDLINDEEAKVYKSFMDLAKDSAYELKRQLLLNKEIRVAALVAAGSHSATPAVKWDADTGTIAIEKDLRNAISTFADQSGVLPNTLIIPKQVWDVVVTDSTLRDIWKLVPGRSNQDIKLSSLMKLLFDNFKKVLIPNSRYDTTKKNKTASLSRIWTDTVSLIYTVPRATAKTFTWAARFEKQGMKTKNWGNEDPEGTWIKISYEEDIKEVCATALYNLTNCLS